MDNNQNIDYKKAIKKENIKQTIMAFIFMFIVIPCFALQTIYFISTISWYNSGITNRGKPIIYIYPTEEMNVTVELGNPELLTCTYPRYEDKWEVKASPNGDLIDLKTGRNLYALYWEGINTNNIEFNEGFVVKGEDSYKFLEEKLAILGLNEREAEEFIVYWLPKLESNEYNLIRFETMEEINSNMPLKITPEPDTLIRVFMEFKGIDKDIEIQEQELTPITRNGYTVVEWGGTEVK